MDFRKFTGWQHTEIWLQPSLSFRNCPGQQNKEEAIALKDSRPAGEGNQAVVKFDCHTKLCDTAFLPVTDSSSASSFFSTGY